MPPQITPWLLGLVSTLMGVLRVQDSSIPYRGRLSLILLDTVFETACFVYLRHVRNWKLAQLGALADSRSRVQLFDEVKKVTKVGAGIWERIDECHRERNERAHFDPNKDIAERFVRGYFETALQFINSLFGISLDEAVLRLEGGLQPDLAPTAAGAITVPTAVADELAGATHLYYLGDLTGALNTASRVAEEFDSPHAHYLVALCLRKSGPAHWDKAVEALAHAIQRPPLSTDPRAYLEYGDMLLRCNRAGDSVQTIEAGFRIGLDRLRGREAFGLYGDALRAICRFGDALGAYRTSLRHDPIYSRGHEGLIETLLTLDVDDEAMQAGEAAVAVAPRNPYFRLLLARAHAAHKDYATAFRLLDEAWDLSTEKGGSGDSRVLLARASFLFAQYKDQQPGSDEAEAAVAKLKRYVQDALDSPAVRPGFRPAFRNFLVGILWREGDLQGAYTEAVRGTRENKYQERNFAYLAAACLATGRWDEGKRAAHKGVDLARQIVVWSLWCELFVLLSSIFLDGPTLENHQLLREWIDRLGRYPEFAPRKFDWFAARNRVEILARDLPAAARALVSDALGALDVHPRPSSTVP